MKYVWMFIFFLCHVSVSGGEENTANRSAKRRPCHKPKGKPWSVRIAGCVKNQCMNGYWISSVRGDTCCYDGHPVQINTTIATLETGWGEVRMECRMEDNMARIVMVKSLTIPDIATQDKVDNQTKVLEKKAEQVMEKIEGLQDNIESKVKDLDAKMEKMLKEQSEKLNTIISNSDDYCPPSSSTPSSSPITPQMETGILVAGWDSSELFLPSKGKSCSLGSLPEPSRLFHTLDTFPNNSAVMCGGSRTGQSCLIFNMNSSSGSWEHFANTTYKRERHTSWVSPNGLMLAGGGDSRTAEIVHSGPIFKYFPWMACSINFENYTIITGGWYTRRSVSKFDAQGNKEELPRLLEERNNHGCGYYFKGDIRILVVAGGEHPSTELLTEGSDSWVFGENLPFPNTIKAMASVSMDNKIFFLGGTTEYWKGDKARREILSYNGSWVEVGLLTTPRWLLAATTIKIDKLGPLDITTCFSD